MISSESTSAGPLRTERIDVGVDAGCASVGINSDTAEFAVNAIRRWHRTKGRKRYPQAGQLLVVIDGGVLIEVGSGSSNHDAETSR